VALTLPVLADTPQFLDSSYSLRYAGFCRGYGVSMPYETDRNGHSGLDSDKVDIIYLRRYLTLNYPDKYDLLMDLIDCESGYNTNRCGDGGKSCGILQFQEETFNDFCKGRRESSEDQIRCASKMIDMGIGGTLQGWYNCFRIKNLSKK